MATEPRKPIVSFRTKRVALRQQANETLELYDHGHHDEALAGAADLVENNKGVSLVHKLIGILYQKQAARLDSHVLAKSFRDKACSAFSEAALLAPKCLLTAVEHAKALADCEKYEEARAELIRAKDVAVPVDPGPSYVGYENEKFNINATSYSDRLATARKKADSALERVEMQVEHRNMLSKAKEFWHNYPNKDSLETVSLQELCEYLVQVIPDQTHSKYFSKSLHDACAFVKEHNQWGFFVWEEREFMDISLLRQYLHTTHEELSSNLEAVVEAKMLGLAQEDAESFSGSMKFTQDDQQRNILHLPSVEFMLEAMKVYPSAKLPLESDIKSKKHSEAVQIFDRIINDIKGFPADMEHAKVQEQTQSSLVKFLQACYFDYHEVLLPLATKFQWPYVLQDKLKQCMSDATAIQNYKEPSSFLLCSKCWKSGHGIKDCDICIVCDSRLHTVAHCPVTKEAKPLAHLVGYGTPGQEFFVANEPGSRHVKALISVEAGKLTVDQLVGEFFSQFDWGWEWSAKQLRQNSFIMKFPDFGKVDELSKSTLLLAKSGAVIKVSKWASEPVPKAKLHRVWIIVHGVPEPRKHHKSLCAIGSMVGAVKEVDMEALEESDLVRIMVDVKDPKKIPQSKEYGVPPYLYDLYFFVESVVTTGGQYEEGYTGFGDDHNSQDNRSYHTGSGNDASHQLTGPSGSTEIGHSDTLAQSAGKETVIRTRHGTTTEPMRRALSRLDFPGTSKGPVENDAEEARKLQIQADYELAIRLQKKSEGRPRRSQDAAFDADAIHENWEVEDEATTEQINKLIGMDGKLAVLLQDQIYQDGDSKPKVVLQEKKSLQTSGKGTCDRRVPKKDIKDHFNEKHEQPDISYECEVCKTRARTSMDIRKHYHFVHTLPADWWPSYIPDMALW
ncbi:hypothetical protein QYE76_053646 [Lolium multiflorum]|uniref:Uncharacterized protein n=1 Tax=Lolium multiflorum TaxID=4521 RepID=A0AAD8SWP5_LOLMU|nr:hypothetical protein QYE76_053646 [Lolium multiflorum]